MRVAAEHEDRWPEFVAVAASRASGGLVLADHTSAAIDDGLTSEVRLQRAAVAARHAALLMDLLATDVERMETSTDATRGAGFGQSLAHRRTRVRRDD